MIKTVAIVSLSAGTIGEDFVKHEVNIGLKRLEQFGLNVKIMPHAMKGIEYVKNHPKERANDLLAAICDEEVDMILCAIGGDDTYRLLPYLFKNNELKEAIEKAEKRKIFLGFSDTTMNHLMLHKLGFGTFYGQSFLADVCEMEDDMLPYTKKFFEELIKTGKSRKLYRVMCGMKRELTGPKVQLVLKEQNMKMRDFNFFKESLLLQERFWEAVLKVYMIYLITADIQIPFLYAKNTIFSLV